MKQVGIDTYDVDGAREEIFNLIQRNPNNNIIYFRGWGGFGAPAVLRSIPQALLSMKAPPPRLRFGRIIYIDCSAWTSKRAMQRKVAEELKLDRNIMAVFEEQDEEDDFNGVDDGSRGVIRQVSAVIDQTMRESRFMMVFLNGSSDQFALSAEFGIPEYHSTIIWTFSRSFLALHGFNDMIKQAADSVRQTDMFVFDSVGIPLQLSESQFNALLREQAASIVARHPVIMQNINLTMVIDCCAYVFSLLDSKSAIGLDWVHHAPSLWICDGIIQGDMARVIGNALHPEIRYEGDSGELDWVFGRIMQHPNHSHHLVIEDEEHDKFVHIEYGKITSYRWVSVTSKTKIAEDNTPTILAGASSIFVAFDRTTFGEPKLPDNLFKLCNKLGVLILSGCAFSFVSPPFLHCQTLRFLGLSNSKHQDNNSTAEVEGGGDCDTKWASCLHGLWVLDLRYTDWGEILSEEKIGLMANLEELNIEGVRCWRYTSQLQKGLPCLERLRIVKPTHREEASPAVDMDSSFEDRKRLEILDLSGNSDMKNIPANLSEASRLQALVLDGCDELENVVLSNSSIRSFSFDGYGAASFWTSSTAGKLMLPPMGSRPKKHPSDDDVDKKDVKTSRISLEGCAMLEGLFLRGLPNLVELDLSGCRMIKVLDFGTMVVDTPRLKRLFLLGCERLRAIEWGGVYESLELICIDTRPGTGSRRVAVLGCAAQQRKSFKLYVHAVIEDARIGRSLRVPITNSASFKISVTSSPACSGGVVQPECGDVGRAIAEDLYGDIFTKVGGEGAAPMQAFPVGPVEQLDRHLEIGDGSRNVESEAEAEAEANRGNLVTLMRLHAESLHVHDVLTCSNISTRYHLVSLVWCRVERCPRLNAVFPDGAEEYKGTLETLWASDLLMARCIWGGGTIHVNYARFGGLRHLHLRRCPSLQYALAMGLPSSFPSLETLHIIHCGSLRHVFVPGDEERRHPSVEFPKLTTIHLHDVPALREICEGAATKMLAPALETIRIRGCWSLRRLPALLIKGRRQPAVEVEKSVWDALEWDGVDAGHHPSLYQPPVHSRYYCRRRMLRVTVLR